MADEKKKRETKVSPLGELMWPFLAKPDTRFKKEGEYRCTLLVDKDDDFLKWLLATAKAGFEEVKAGLKPKSRATVEMAEPFEVHYDENEEPTDKVEVRFKTNAVFKDKKGEEVSLKPKLFDAQGKLIEKDLAIGNGSKGKINFTWMSSFVPSTGKIFLTLYLNAVQIVELKEFAPSAESYGFGVEDGYSVEEDVPFESDSDF